MQQPIVPHLCGGIFFALVLQAIKPRRKTRDRLKGGTDKLSNKDVFAGLTKVLTGETLQVVGETLDKCVSLFKSCQDNGGTYVPFTNPVVVSSFDVAVKEKNPDIYARMTDFINTFLGHDSRVWLVRALVETIQQDRSIPETAMFDIDYYQAKGKNDLDKIKVVVLQAFLISVLHYVLMNAPDAKSGRPTFETWFEQSGKNAPWKYRGHVGESIQPMKVILTDYGPNLGNQAVAAISTDNAETHPVKAAPADRNLNSGNEEPGDNPESSGLDKYVLGAYEKYRWMRLPGEGEFPLEDYYVCNNLGISSAVYPLRIKGNVIEQATLAKIKTFDKRAEIWCALIIGACGFGKTLMLQHLFIGAVNRRAETGMVPIFAELRNFSASHTGLLPFLVETIQEYNQYFSEDALVEYLSKGKVQILLDGLDEMDPKETIHFQKELAKLRQRYPNNQVVISSRQCAAISGIRNCVHFYLHPLSEKQSDELIDRLLVGIRDEGAKETVKAFTKPETGYVMNNGFIATNPMLLTIMVRKYEQLRNFNGSKVKFYDILYKELISGHDAEKQAYGRFFHSVLDGTEFTHLFREFCATSFLDGVFEFNDRTFEKYFNKLQEKKTLSNPAKCKLTAFQKDVCATACMMYEQDSGIYYIDPGFQEYFLAEFFFLQDDQDKNKAIGRFFWTGKINSFPSTSVLNLLYEMADEKTEVFIVLPYLETIFKGKPEDEAFLNFLSYGYGNIRYILQDRPLIYSFLNNKAEKYVSPVRSNYAKGIMLLLCDILNCHKVFEVGFMAETVQPDEFTTHFFVGYYDDVKFQNEDDDVSHTLLFSRPFEIAHLGDTEYIRNSENMPLPALDKRTGQPAVFGYLYELNPLSLLDKPKQQKEFIKMCKINRIWEEYEIVKAFYQELIDKQKVNKYR